MKWKYESWKDKSNSPKRSRKFMVPTNEFNEYDNSFVHLEHVELLLTNREKFMDH